MFSNAHAMLARSWALNSQTCVSDTAPRHVELELVTYACVWEMFMRHSVALANTQNSVLIYLPLLLRAAPYAMPASARAPMSPFLVACIVCCTSNSNLFVFFCNHERCVNSLVNRPNETQQANTCKWSTWLV
eukprot:gnl/MRDRNA2_/MRDRNA2_24982_c0_seq1.p1 gnl/MRDRNA2_/MRDRNA2_24982_c0~~gnl/MRDRNA2_/MRDRNA2_24982_c0_seq1.p1  ORF type:complete len:132 (+),score=1.59 gnl/MRDRNA2_/MRDRNA2_24982_c0_seq1:154-549(+)